MMNQANTPDSSHESRYGRSAAEVIVGVIVFNHLLTLMESSLRSDPIPTSLPLVESQHKEV
jgi:hypothetical protein